MILDEQPYFDNMPTKIHVYDHLPVGTPVLTLEPVDTTDDDITVSIQSTSTYFEIDSTTCKYIYDRRPVSN